LSACAPSIIATNAPFLASMRNFVFVLLFIGGMIITNSCQTKENKVKVGFLFSDFNSSRWEREANYFKERINSLGGEALIAVAGGDEAKQYSQAKEFISQGVQVLIITAANANTAAAIVRDAHNSGVKVIAYDGLIRNAELDYLVGFDLEEVGELQAQYVLKKRPEGNYIILNGDKVHQAAIDMNNGIMKILGPAINDKKIDIIYSAWIENWSGTNAFFYANKILEFSGKKIDAIIAANDGIAGGVADELRARGITNTILLTGQDGDLDACNRIYNGEQTMTVYKSSKLIAYAAADLALKIARNEKPEGLKYLFNGRLDIPTVLLEPIAVDKANIESTIIAEGIYSLDEFINYTKSDN
jgi:D-xylose transport system substrate-binding protein